MKISTHLSRKLPRGFARLLTVALAASALVLPTQALAQAPVVSEKTAGLWQPSQSMNADGSDQRPLLESGPTVHRVPGWQPLP